MDVDGWDIQFNGWLSSISANTAAGESIPLTVQNLIELPDTESPVVSLTFGYTATQPWDPYGHIRSVQAYVDGIVVLSANSQHTLDHQFSWDLDNDGIYDDRDGRSISLTADDLRHFGLDQPGEHVVSVRMNDRVQDYFDTTTLHILQPDVVSPGDINGNGNTDFEDFVIIAANFGRQSVGRNEGDLNNDLEVTFLDFLVLANNFAVDAN